MEHPAERVNPNSPDETLTIIVPAFNEAATIEEALRRLWSVRLPVPCEIIVVDDGSRDDSYDIASRLQGESPHTFILLRHDTNRGKTAAIRTALEAASGSLTLIYDADLEYDPGDIPALLNPVLDGRADAVYGSRFLSPERRVLFFWHALGNRLVTALANMFANLNLTDMETCFKLVRTTILKEMRLRSERFGYEPEVTVKLGRLGLRIYEVPIRYSGRSYEEGKKIGWRDAVRAFGTIIRAGVFEPPLSTPEGITRFSLSRLGSYYAEILRRVEWAISDEVLEVASGAGGLARHLAQKSRLVLSDPGEEEAARLRTLFSHRPNVEVRRWDHCRGPMSTPPETFDTIICFHSLDCLDEDTAALGGIAQHLAGDGRVVLLLPALPSLFGKIDRSLGRKRRYSREDVYEMIEKADLRVEWLNPVNSPGAVGWWISSFLFRSSRIRPWNISVFRLFMPILKIERWITPPFGLSYLVVARSLSEKRS